MNEKYINVDGLSIRYVSEGKGPELLLFHGFGEFLETWLFNLDFLSQYYTVYAIDLPGHGLSQEPKVGYTLDFGTRVAISFMEALEIKHASLIGHSVCGSLCLKLAIKCPEKVDKLILVGSTGLCRREASYLYRLIALFNKALDWPTKTIISAAVKRAFYNPYIVTEKLMNNAYRYLTMPKTRDALQNILRSNVEDKSIKPETLMSNNLHLVSSPTLVIHGIQDRVIPVEHIQGAYNLIPEAKLEVFDECGHFPHIEKANEFNQTTLAFLMK